MSPAQTGASLYANSNIKKAKRMGAHSTPQRTDALFERVTRVLDRSVSIRAVAIALLKLAVLAAVIWFLPALLHRLTGSAPRPGSESARRPLGIAQMIQDVRAELAEAEKAADANNEAKLFQARSFDLEVSFVASSVDTASGKVDYEVVTVENETTVSAETVQKLTLRFDAIPPKSGSTSSTDSHQPDSGATVVEYGPKPAKE